MRLEWRQGSWQAGGARQQRPCTAAARQLTAQVDHLGHQAAARGLAGQVVALHADAAPAGQAAGEDVGADAHIVALRGRGAGSWWGW